MPEPVRIGLLVTLAVSMLAFAAFVLIAVSVTAGVIIAVLAVGMSVLWAADELRARASAADFHAQG